MSITYDEDGADVLIEGETCPTCSGTHTLYDSTFGFWKCEDCSTVWGKDIDDPDYDEADEEELDYCSLCRGTGYVEELLSTCPDCGGQGFYS